MQRSKLTILNSNYCKFTKINLLFELAFLMVSVGLAFLFVWFFALFPKVQSYNNTVNILVIGVWKTIFMDNNNINNPFP